MTPETRELCVNIVIWSFIGFAVLFLVGTSVSGWVFKRWISYKEEEL